MYLAGSIIGYVLQIYLGLLFLRMVLSWIPAFSPDFHPRGAVLVIFEAVYTLTDPPIRFFTRLLPNVRIGQIAFSLGYLAAFLAVMLLMRVNALIFFS